MNASQLWSSESVGARAARAALTPLSWVYQFGVAVRNRAFDEGWLKVERSQLPVLSVGNLSVGGTGKTPVAAQLVRQLTAGGARPGLVLRGYGGDEVLVHRHLNPLVPVIADPDRVRGVRRACEAGCDVVVLDDAFQHRRIARVEDIVLMSAERFTLRPRVLPAGPWREGFNALSRATLVLVTRKTAPRARAEEIAQQLQDLTAIPIGIVSLVTDVARSLDHDEERPLATLRDARLLAVAGIGNPEAFAGQLRGAGLRVELRAYGDHHAYSVRDVEEIVSRRRDVDAVLCTLKDAVKLTPLWPRTAPPLWYVSQRIVQEMGEGHVEAALAHVLQSRP